ncbi:unnamed protein product [Bursaphelenchus okinawaensis]|uniref:acid phosphatase n=1 Tax=Bursaphelenchus okinawaensis TaxID=465554 RepID=A0A811K2C3_9BILA|nr:unnamed protein product [Bursaphelenchus okinawaensis]CAG9089736.1 unnamed protein product [Bursaphelenchus okinawaensis]
MLYTLFFNFLLFLTLVVSIAVGHDERTVFHKRQLRSVTDIPGEGRLVFVHALWRHGDRMPDIGLPADKNVWPWPIGELTINGMKDQFLLGEKLRKRYIEAEKSLNPRFDTSEIFIRSSDKNRTLVSASSTMLGMYSKNAVKGEDYPDVPGWPSNYVAVPIHTQEYSTDYVANVNRKCPRLRELLNYIYNTCPEGVKTQEENKDLFKRLTELAGTKISIQNLWMVHDYAMVCRTYNKTFEGMNETLFHRIEVLDDYIDHLQFGIGVPPHNGLNIQLEMARLRGGPMITDMINRMEMKMKCDKMKENDDKGDKECQQMKKLKFYGYSAHDMTISALFSVFGFPSPNYQSKNLPRYSTAVTLELREINREYVIRLLFWPPIDDTYQDITPEIQNCGPICTYGTFRHLAENFMVEDAQKMCETPLFYHSNDNKTVKGGSYVLINIVLLVFLALLALY